MASIHDGHRERLKNTFRKGGLAPMQPHNALELILTYAVPRRDTNELAHRLIDEFGGFDKVLEADYERLIAIKGVTPHVATLLKLLPESYRYYEQQRNREAFFATSSEAAMRYAKSLFVGETNEMSYLMCFDSSMKLLQCALLSQGSVTATSVSVRRAVEVVTANRAVSAILAHNHPGGLPMPSPDDIETTKQVVQALRLVGCELADHIVVGATQAISMAQSSALHNIQLQLEK